MTDVGIEHIEFLARIGKWEHLKGFFCSVGSDFRSSMGPARFPEIYETVRIYLHDSQDMCRLMDLHFISAFLLFPHAAPEWFGPWLEENTDLQSALPDMDLRSALEGTWNAVPAIITLDEALVRYFIVGMAPGLAEYPLWPSWAGLLMHDTTKKAIGTASRAAARITPLPRGYGIYCFPLTIPNRTIQFQGSSLGLPLALGFLSALTRTPFPGSMIATGTLDENGAILPVERLDLKIRKAEQDHFDVLLYPSQGPLAPVTRSMEILPVSRLDEARMFSALYRRGQGRDLLHWQGVLGDPRRFARNWCDIPHEWLAWAHENGRISSTMNQILDSPEWFKAFVDTFDACLNQSKQFTACETMAKSIGPEHLKKATRTAPLATFRWHTLNLALANHRGRIEDALACATWASPLIDQARAADLNACADYHNNRFVTLHNLYRFSRDLPEDVSRTLADLEARYRAQCLAGCPTDPTLGALCGSITQNFAFCGPGCFAQTEKYSLLARKAFGGGGQPEYREGWQRQLHYLAYAELDAGLHERAEKTLSGYLGIDRREDLWDKLPALSPFQHALIARYLGDVRTPALSERYLDMAVSLKNNVVTCEHPWQIWMYNLGRLSHAIGRAEQAAEWFSESLDLCLSDAFGPTVHVMALLPLSGLWSIGGLSKVDYKGIEKRVRKAAEGLDQGHFRLLRGHSLEHILERVWQEPGLLFPFTYH